MDAMTSELLKREVQINGITFRKLISYFSIPGEEGHKLKTIKATSGYTHKNVFEMLNLLREMNWDGPVTFAGQFLKFLFLNVISNYAFPVRAGFIILNCDLK